MSKTLSYYRIEKKKKKKTQSNRPINNQVAYPFLRLKRI